MTIRDIAKIAEVSPATVSKIINKKDSNISQETREKVLRIIKEYNYTPYSNIRKPLQGTTLLIGVLVESGKNTEKKLTGVLKAIHTEGYNVVVCPVYSNKEIEKKIEFLLSYNVDGIVIICEEADAYQTIDLKETPFVIIEENAAGKNYGIRYSELAKRAVAELIDKKHKKIVCYVPDNGSISKDFISGFQHEIVSQGLTYYSENALVFSAEDLPLQISRYSAAVCLTKAIADKIRIYLLNLGILIPTEFSLICVEASDSSETPVSTISVDNTKIGDYATTSLIHHLESINSNNQHPDFISGVNHYDTISESKESRASKIVSVGTINMDIYYSLNEIIQPGGQITISNCVKMPGGKGLNQALGVAKLGVQTQLISCLGKDYEGGIIYDYLKANGIGVDGITFLSGEKTGNCTILGTPGGETTIYGFDGASKYLSSQHIFQSESLFTNASYCIMQDSNEENILPHVLETAHKHACKVLLRPASTDWSISKLKNLRNEKIDIFQVNRRTLMDIFPDSRSLEEKAVEIRTYGVDCVIITLGHKGYYLQDAYHSEFFPAIKLTPVDTTGAADEFSATLCVYLSEGKDICTAAKYANIAAGLSTTRHGVATAMVDRETIELYMAKQK